MREQKKGEEGLVLDERPCQEGRERSKEQKKASHQTGGRPESSYQSWGSCVGKIQIQMSNEIRTATSPEGLLSAPRRLPNSVLSCHGSFYLLLASTTALGSEASGNGSSQCCEA